MYSCLIFRMKIVKPIRQSFRYTRWVYGLHVLIVASFFSNFTLLEFGNSMSMNPSHLFTNLPMTFCYEENPNVFLKIYVGKMKNTVSISSDKHWWIQHQTSQASP